MVLVVIALVPNSARLAERMDDFLAALRLGGPEKARGYLTKHFASVVSNEQLEHFSKSVGLAGSVSANWSREVVDEGQPFANLYGSLTVSRDDKKQVLPVRVIFAREDDSWQIQTIGIDAPGLLPTAKPNVVPDTSKLVAKVNTVFRLFDESIQRGDMRPLWMSGSHVWKTQFSIEKLDEAYRPFLKKKVSFAGLKKYSPVFERPVKVLENGILEVRGHYPTKPDRVYFHQRFVYEGLDWALVGFAVELRPGEPAS